MDPDIIVQAQYRDEVSGNWVTIQNGTRISVIVAAAGTYIENNPGVRVRVRVVQPRIILDTISLQDDGVVA